MLEKSGLKFRHGGGWYQKWPKKFRRLIWTAPKRLRSLLLRRTKLLQIGRPVEIVKKIGLNGEKNAEQLDISLASGK